jgi:hypothetical protein
MYGVGLFIEETGQGDHSLNKRAHRCMLAGGYSLKVHTYLQWVARRTYVCTMQRVVRHMCTGQGRHSSNIHIGGGACRTLAGGHSLNIRTYHAVGRSSNIHMYGAVGWLVEQTGMLVG